MPQSTVPSPTLLSLAQAYPHDPAHLHNVILPQLAHRLRLAALWSIAPSTKVLDIGCGQGDSALVLAHAVAPSTPDGGSTDISGTGTTAGASPGPAPGHVTALDPAPGDYGAPYTLAEAQSHILSSSPYGAHITFHRSDAPSYLASNSSATFDSATLCHSLWYFPSRAAVVALFGALHSSRRIGRLCLAEYCPQARTPSQEPHEMAVAAQARLHALREARGKSEPSDANVRCAPDPEELVALAREAGWVLKERGSVDTPGMLDGQWEVGSVLAADWTEEVAREGLGREAEEELLGCVAKIEAAVADLKKDGEKVQTLDAAWVVMER